MTSKKIDFKPQTIAPLQTQDIRLSREGFEFDYHAMKWKLSRDYSINLDWVKERLGDEFARSYRSHLAFYAKKYSAVHTVFIDYHCNELIRFIQEQSNSNSKVTKINTAHIISFRSSLLKKQEHHLGKIRSFLTTWVERKLPGIEPEVAALLKGWRLQGNEKGRAVQTLCPKQGALSDLEYEAVHSALPQAFENRKIDLEQYVLTWLGMATGRRPAQLGDLKICDFVEAKASNEDVMSVLQVPRRKQRGVAWREEKKVYALSPELGAIVKQHIDFVKQTYEEIHSTQEGVKKLALFPDWQAVKNAGLNDLTQSLDWQDFHRTSRSISSQISNTVSKLKVISERTGEELRATPIRFRRTLGTRAAREGYGVLTIAELLDHTDTQNASVYTENTPEHLHAINRAMAEQLAPIAQAFSGVLVNSEEDAIRGNDLSSRVKLYDTGENVGTCGNYSFCGAFAPIACYTCKHFQPWLGAPHDVLLETLIAKRKALMDRTGDSTIAAINDRTIFAVAQVVELCKQRKQPKLEVSADE